MLDLDRKLPARAAHQRCLAQMPGEPGAVQRGRHEQQLEVGPQRCLHLQAQGQAQIGVERALVEFVENHRSHRLRVPGRAAAGASAALRSPPRSACPGRSGGRTAWRSRRCRPPPRRAAGPSVGRPHGRPGGVAPASAPAARRARARRRRCNGTSVVLPAPGGASSTADGWAASASRSQAAQPRSADRWQEGRACPRADTGPAGQRPSTSGYNFNNLILM